MTINLSGPVTASAVTNKFGEYGFKNLPAGTYTVSEVVQSGWKQTVPGGNVPKLGFKPKFKAGVTKPATEEQNEQPAAEDKAAETNSTGEAPAAAATPKLGFKPKFKAAEIPKPAAGEKAAPAEPEKQPDEASNTDEPVQGAKAAQPYKPRFNMKNMPPKGA